MEIADRSFVHAEGCRSRGSRGWTGTTTIMEAAGDAKMRRVVRSVGTQLTDRQRVKDRGEIERERKEREKR